MLASTDPAPDYGYFLLAPGGEVVAQRVMPQNAQFILGCVQYVRAQLGSAGGERAKLSTRRRRSASSSPPSEA
jgi:hypothetical protein